MRAVRLHGSDDLRVETIPTPTPSIGDVLVEVHAAGFTPTELEWPSTLADRLGRERGPVVPGHEVSGVVVASGPGTLTFSTGDAVFGLTDWYRDGGMAQYVAVEARNLAPQPASLAPVAAAALSLAGLTASQALFDHGRLAPGQRVAILGAAGAVGHLACELALRAGAVVVAADRAHHHEELEASGAAEVVDSDGFTIAPVDLVVDLIGPEAAERAAAALRPGGRIVSVVADPAECARAAGGEGMYFIVEPDRETLVRLANLVQNGELAPRVGATSSLEDAPAAIAAKQRHELAGKLVVLPSG
jgi:NADPH:quinone reductase-like Zn-dependent oxidoreductase